MNNLKGKRLLVQGAGRGNLGIMKSAINHGVYTIVTGMGGNYPCTSLANENCYVDITDVNAVLCIAKEKNIDGAIICCSDTGLNAIGRCNDILNLSGISEMSAVVSSNKLLMKEKLVANGVRTSQFCCVHNEREVLNVIGKLKFPLIIKATDLQGSRGINIVKDSCDLLSAYNDVMTYTKKDYCIIEEYIIGKEFGAQSFVYNGEVLFVLPHGDETIMCKTAVPVGHYMPYEMSDELYNDTCLQIKKSIDALGFNNCPVNVDLIERDGKAYIIELTGRVGANCLPELTSNYFGINYYDMILNVALGESPLDVFKQRRAPCATLARMVRSAESGVVESVTIPKLVDTDICMFIKEGDTIRTFTNCNDAIGQVVVKGEKIHECEVKMATALAKIEIKMK